MKQYESKEKLMEALLKCLPYPDQIQGLDLSKEDSIYFTWRSTKFKVDIHGMVDETDGCMLRGSDITILLEAIMKRQIVDDMRKAQKDTPYLK